ncbi:alpha-1,2-mannosyltransferase [Halopolyspora algeriensis]|uniref:Alpha-1,2-mannosyltransferase n=1 Tax=Halopolyspora algeriensis TaxID=1500506 RepID=A0A368W1W3_9ACTN|nr:glycosyltransferase 87 family protein [Halopolyspora algeriensis]RCW47194.1 alpha-1,2-mannosyltransferase [Halopolyspora algeriensis]TQM48280.1 alpha-1,2-mannosyltransferase [Halopolyspora algeriensis]
MQKIREHRKLLSVIGLAELIAVIMVSAINPHAHIDGEVYRLGAQTWLSGQNLYQELPATESGLYLPFIYPPFAAIVFTPLALVPKPTAVVMIMIITHLSLLGTLYVVLNTAPFLAAHRDKVLMVAAAVLPLATVTEPVIETFTYAQINVVLMALVAVDCLWRTGGDRRLPYPRGMLIGVAAGIKLTPAAFLLFFLLRRDYRSIATALATFLGTVLIGLVLAFDSATRFWSYEILTNGEVSFGPQFEGNAAVYAGNQSLRSLLTQIQIPEPWLTVVFGLLVLIMLALALLGMRHNLRRDNLPMALTVNGILALLISPISWSHHWVWVVPGLVLLLGAAIMRSHWPLVVAGTLVAEFFVLGPHWTVPQGDGKELTWNFFELLIGNAYVFFGVAFLLYHVHGWWQARGPAAPTPIDESVAGNSSVPPSTSSMTAE